MAVGSDGKLESTPEVKGESDATNIHRDTNGALSIKLPTDAAKISEAVSTPGSTAASATTPAPHESSTDTSPDNEGPRLLDAAGRKEQDEDAMAKLRRQSRTYRTRIKHPRLNSFAIRTVEC